MREKEKDIREVNKSSIDELQDQLSEGLYENNIKLIENLARSKDVFIRIRLAIILSKQKNTHAENILLRLLHDRSYLVQVEAIDSLFSFCSERVQKEVWACMTSIHPLVRGYAYRYVCLIYNLNDKAVEKELNTIIERNTWARIMLNIGLLQRGDSTKLHRLFATYNRCNYLNRCAILNGLSDIFDDCSDEEKDYIRNFLKKNQKKERPKTVDESFSRLYKISAVV